MGFMQCRDFPFTLGPPQKAQQPVEDVLQSRSFSQFVLLFSSGLGAFHIAAVPAAAAAAAAGAARMSAVEAVAQS